jgi:hypothetical protein
MLTRLSHVCRQASELIIDLPTFASRRLCLATRFDEEGSIRPVKTITASVGTALPRREQNALFASRVHDEQHPFRDTTTLDVACSCFITPC